MWPTVEKRRRKLGQVSFPKDNFNLQFAIFSSFVPVPLCPFLCGSGFTVMPKLCFLTFLPHLHQSLIGWVFKPFPNLNLSPWNYIQFPKLGHFVILLALEEQALTTGIRVFLHSYITIYWLGICTAAFWVTSVGQYQLKSFSLDYCVSPTSLRKCFSLFRWSPDVITGPLFLWLTSIKSFLLSLQVSNGDMAEAVAFLTEKNAKVPQQDETTYYQTSQVASDRYISVGSQADTSKQRECLKNLNYTNEKKNRKLFVSKM